MTTHSSARNSESQYNMPLRACELINISVLEKKNTVIILKVLGVTVENYHQGAVGDIRNLFPSASTPARSQLHKLKPI